ncbi:MAG TPA: glycosyltransferase family 39 protein [Bryobacteraceae bacterium]|nr:glycosyltransferase family 39 protein [Bryobacteraceae bacterium]
MPAALYILFGASFTVVVSTSLGKLLLNRLAVKLYRQEQFLLAFVVGAPCLSTVVFLLSAAHLAYKGVFLVVGVLAIGGGVVGRTSRPLPPLAPLPRLWKIIFTLAFTAFTILYFTNAMAPEISPDGAGYHLGLVDHYYRAHGFVKLPNVVYASLSEGTEMLFFFAYAFGKHSAAAMVHFAFLVVLALLIVSWGRRSGFPGVGVTAALLVYASPIVGIDGTSAYNDLTAACVIFAVFYTLQLWNTDRAQGWLIPIGLLSGFCYAVKYTAALAIPYAVVYILWRGRKLRAAAIVAACAALMIAPWIAKNWLWTANPFAPFFNQIFPNPYIHVQFEREYRDQMSHFGDLPNAWRVFLDLTLHGTALGGLLGPIFLLAPIALLALRRHAGREVLLAFAIFFAPYFTNLGTRFTIPALPFLAIAMGLAVVDVPVALVAMAVVQSFISWPSIVHRYAPQPWRLQRILVRPALRLIPEDKWLSRSANYVAVRMVERNVPPGEPVFMLNGTAEAYTKHDIIVRFESAEAETLGDTLFTGLVTAYQPTHLEEFHFAPRTLRRVRVVQTAKGSDLWSVSELRVYNGSTELSRNPRWRLRACPDPWEVQLAFDNSPVTRWRSWQPITPGMFIEVDFGHLETVDRVRLECSPDQGQVRVKLEGMDDSGRWATLSTAPQQFDIPPPAGMRLAATEQLKRHGIHYMMVFNNDFGADDYRGNADQWGFTLLQEQAGAWLYRLDGRKTP